MNVEKGLCRAENKHFGISVAVAIHTVGSERVSK
jgi:hypothetical protein